MVQKVFQDFGSLHLVINLQESVKRDDIDEEEFPEYYRSVFLGKDR